MCYTREEVQNIIELSSSIQNSNFKSNGCQEMLVLRQKVSLTSMEIWILVPGRTFGDILRICMDQ